MAEVKDKIITAESLKTVYDTLNENKAPSGFGLGESSVKYYPNSESEFNEMLTEAVDKLPDGSIGFCTFVDDTGFVFSGGVAIATIYKANNSYSTVTFVKYHSSNISRFVKTFYDGEWLPLAWENPSMQLGVEYRTTERYKGKAVYTKLIEFGYLPAEEENNSVRVFEEGEDITNVEVIDIDGIARGGSNNTTQTIPFMTWSNGLGAYAQYHNDTGYISVISKQDLSNYQATFKFKYTKD